MAGELTYNLGFTLTKDGATNSTNAQCTLNVSDDGYIKQIVTLVNGDQTLARGGISSPGFFYGRALPGNTGAFSIGSVADDAKHPVSLAAGQACQFPIKGGADIHVYATAGQLLEYAIVDS